MSNADMNRGFFHITATGFDSGCLGWSCRAL